MTVCGLNSLAPVRFQFNFRKVIFKLTLVNGGWGISYENALRWMPLDLTDDTSTLVQVMAWCRQATSHYLSQCWPRSMSPNGVTRPQWVKWWVNCFHMSIHHASHEWCARTKPCYVNEEFGYKSIYLISFTSKWVNVPYSHHKTLNLNMPGILGVHVV